jgi:hypothetical protein
MMHFLPPHIILASDSCSTGIFGNGTPGLYDHLCKGSDVSITAVSNVIVLISNVIQILLLLAGSLGVIFLIVGGIFYVISAGDPARLKRAKEIITNVIVGLVIIFLAYAVVNFISKGLI